MLGYKNYQKLMIVISTKILLIECYNAHCTCMIIRVHIDRTAIYIEFKGHCIMSFDTINKCIQWVEKA